MFERFEAFVTSGPVIGSVFGLAVILIAIAVALQMGR